MKEKDIFKHLDEEDGIDDTGYFEGPQGKQGPKGDKGDSGHTPTDQELLRIIIPLIPRVKDGHTPTKEELLDLIRPLIPKVTDGHTPTKDELKALISPIVVKYVLLYKKEFDNRIQQLTEKVENVKLKPAEIKRLKEAIKNDFAIFFRENINTLGMPDFRKLAMGLQEQIDKLASGEAETTGLQYKIFVTVGRTDADYITDGTADDVQIQAAIDYVSGLGGGIVWVKKGTYNTTAQILLESSVTLIGEDKSSTIIKMGANANLSVLGNRNTTTGDSYITIKDITIDQNGNNQTSAGGGASFTYITDLIIENVLFETSYNFNLLILTDAGTLLTGTLTFTNNDATVSGSGTSFTTELSVGSIIKSAGGRFGRVLSIASNTSLELEQIWGFTTETGVAARILVPNTNNKLVNCQFNGSLNTDNVGLGTCDYGLVQGCLSQNSGGGYGFGPDHCYGIKFIGNTCINNDNDGIGGETVAYSLFVDNILEDNGANGIRLLSGSYRNIISNNQTRRNVNGIQIHNVSSIFPAPSDNEIVGNICELNSGHGIRVGGANRTAVLSNKCFNNGTSSIGSGIAIITEQSVVPESTIITGNHCYDTQDVKTQNYGINISGGNNTQVYANFCNDADHTNAGYTDSGTNTLLNSSQPGIDPHYHGAWHVDNTTNPGIGLSLYTNHAGSATAPLGWVRNDNTAFDQDVFVIDNDSTTTTKTTLRVTGGTGSSAVFDSNSTGVVGTLFRNVSANRTGLGTAALLAVHQDAATSAGDVLNVTADATGNALSVDQNGVLGSLKYALFVDSNGVQTTSDLVRFRMDNSSSTRDVLFIDNDGTGRGVFIDHDDTGTNPSVDIDRDGNNAGTITGLKINTANAGAGGARSLWIEAGAAEFDGRILGGQGADVASANDLTLGLDGNTFEITGTTQVNAITTANWQNGSLITLLFTSTPTVKHNTAGSAGTAVILLAGAVDFVASAGDTLSLRLCEIGGTQAWREIGRAVI